MFVFRSEATICSSHQGGPGSIHGHNFRIVAHVEAEDVDSSGRVLPRGGLAALLWEVLEPIDHRHLDDLDCFAQLPPTPANLARWVSGRLSALMEAVPSVRVRRVEVWSSANSCAAWESPREA